MQQQGKEDLKTHSEMIFINALGGTKFANFQSIRPIGGVECNSPQLVRQQGGLALWWLL